MIGNRKPGMKRLPIILSTAYRPASSLARKSNYFFRQMKIAISIKFLRVYALINNSCYLHFRVLSFILISLVPEVFTTFIPCSCGFFILLYLLCISHRVFSIAPLNNCCTMDITQRYEHCFLTLAAALRKAQPNPGFAPLFPMLIAENSGVKSDWSTSINASCITTNSIISHMFWKATCKTINNNQYFVRHLS